MASLALVFTDVVDSTQVVERLGDARSAELWARHDRQARDLLTTHGGREVDRTDGFFLTFGQVADAARFAIDYQQAMSALGLAARVGIHLGEVTLRENDAADIARGAKPLEVEGLAKPFTARIMSLARGGQTLLSPAACATLADALPDGSALGSHGHYRLKGIAEPVQLFELGLADRSAFTPPEDSDKAYRVLRDGELWQPLRAIRHNLSAERDAFIGRVDDLRALSQRLDDGARLISLLGPAGTGKTRLVRRYGRAWLGDWPGGVYFCDLSDARSLDGVLFAVAVALDVPLGKSDPVVQLGHAIAGRGRCLVILDNFEQVTAHAGATLGHWLDRAGDAAFVVTSRERLHLAGEEVLAVEPLPLGLEAVELFAARAKAQRPGFALTGANHDAVAEVVRLLDGLPLAIELAAARVQVFSPAQLVQRLRDRFALLAGARGVAARQATLRAAIDWSWDLLAPWERAALAQCSVFEGGFTIEAAEAVLDLAPWPEAPPAMDAVQALLDKSLLRSWVRHQHEHQHERLDIDEPYFGMYLSIHEYAAAKLDASAPNATPVTQQRHGRYFARLGTDEAIESLSLRGGVTRRRALALELENLVAACRRAMQSSQAEMAVACTRAAWEVIELKGPFNLASDMGTRLLTIAGMAPHLRITALWTRALVAWRTGHSEEARAWLVEALDLSRGTGDRVREARVLGSLGNLYQSMGRLDEAKAHQEAALTIHRATAQRRAEGTTLGNLGNAHFALGNLDLARVTYEQALDIHREVGNRVVEGSVLSNLGGIHFEQGRLAQALACCEQALAIHRETDDRRSVGVVLGNISHLLLAQGQNKQALEHTLAALAIHREMGDRQFEGTALNSLSGLHQKQGQLPEALACCEAALVVMRETGDHFQQGVVLGNYGELLTQGGRHGDARDALRTGEVMLRGISNQLGLAKMLCHRGQADLHAGDAAGARAALVEAQALAKAMGTGAQSELGDMIAALNSALCG